MKVKYEYRISSRANKFFWRQTRKQLGRELTKLRMQSGYSLSDVNQITHTPLLYLENLESGGADLIIGHLLVLAHLYGKKIKIKLQTPTTKDWNSLPPLPGDNPLPAETLPG